LTSCSSTVCAASLDRIGGDAVHQAAGQMGRRDRRRALSRPGRIVQMMHGVEATLERQHEEEGHEAQRQVLAPAHP
jgi:hypothetical protein